MATLAVVLWVVLKNSAHSDRAVPSDSGPYPKFGVLRSNSTRVLPSVAEISVKIAALHSSTLNKASTKYIPQLIRSGSESTIASVQKIGKPQKMRNSVQVKVNFASFDIELAEPLRETLRKAFADAIGAPHDVVGIHKVKRKTSERRRRLAEVFICVDCFILKLRV